jgi:hypothetical protein
MWRFTRAGKWAAALHSGYGQNEITVVQLPQGEVISRAPINESFYGLVFNSRGTELFCSGAGDEVVHRFQFRNGYLSDHQEVTLRRAASRGIPAGIALDPDGERLYCANVWGQSIDIVSLRSGLVKSIVLSTNIPTPAGLAPAKNEDEAAITKRAEAALQEANSEIRSHMAVRSMRSGVASMFRFGLRRRSVFLMLKPGRL